MSKLMDKLIKGSTIKQTSAIADSDLYATKDMVPTDIPMLNVALSGKLDGGISPGLLQIAGPSKHFKTGLGLVLAAAYQKHYPESIVLFYDSEFGAPQGYFDSFGVDMDRVVHTPIKDVEQLKFDMLAQLKNIDTQDRVIIVIDSIGNLASRKEVEDAENEKSVADMTRAKQMKSFGRIITPYLHTKEIPVVAINHTYQEIGGNAPRQIVGGGTGLYYSANDIWIVGRQQEKEGSDIIGYNFIINIEKSRYVREKAKIPLSVTFEEGINRRSGLFEKAVELGFIIQSGAWYKLPSEPDKSIRRADIESNEAFWEALIKDQNFQAAITSEYKL